MKHDFKKKLISYEKQKEMTRDELTKYIYELESELYYLDGFIKGIEIGLEDFRK